MMLTRLKKKRGREVRREGGREGREGGKEP